MNHKLLIYFEGGKFLELEISKRIDFSEFSKSRHFIIRTANKEILIDMDKVLFVSEEEIPEKPNV